MVKTCFHPQVELAYDCFELLAEGNLTVTGTKKKIRVILLNNALLLAKEEKCGQLEYKAHIMVDFFLEKNVL